MMHLLKYLKSYSIAIKFENQENKEASQRKFYHKMLLNILDEVKVCYLHGHGPGLLFSKRAVNNMDEIKGLKVRSVSVFK